MRLTIFLFILLMHSQLAYADPAPDIIATIKPLHSLISNITKGVTEPVLLIKDNNSPHNYSLQPSTAKLIHQADIIFYISEDLEHSIINAAHKINPDALLIQATNLHEVMLLPNRYLEDKEPSNHTHHHHSKNDIHIWLDPINAIAISKAITNILIAYDPAHEDAYQQNMKKLVKRLKDLDQQISSSLSKVKIKPYFVFHDAYQYFENRYNLKPAGVINVHPDQPLSVASIKSLYNQIRGLKNVCLYKEPQFSSKIIHSIAQDTKATLFTLDPIGYDIKIGEDLYFTLLTNLTNNFLSCLNKI